jgi:hypothetical protein
VADSLPNLNATEANTLSDEISPPLPDVIVHDDMRVTAVADQAIERIRRAVANLRPTYAVTNYQS